MSQKQAFINELKHESSLTKKMLERVPLENASWKPHDKSYTLGRLATHIAQTPHSISEIVHHEEFDFATRPYPNNTATSTEELITIFQQTLHKAIADLEKMDDEEFARTWTVRRGDYVISQFKKNTAIRGWAFSHFIHHRGQLSVYLRLLDVAVPGMYGPSADERN
jgi:uncharacterized damage-inducible protein DinB